MYLGRISLTITLLAGLSVTAPNAMPARSAQVDGAAVERTFRPDGSFTWTTRSTANGLGDNAVSGVFAIGDLVYAATAGGLSTSTDGGATFTNKTVADGLGSNRLTGVFVDGSVVYASGYAYGGYFGGLSISTDGGSSFTARYTGNGLGSNTVRDVFASGSKVYAATYNGLSISTDGGDSFINKGESDGLGSRDVYGVFAVGNTVYAATVHAITAGGLSISTDGGDTFTNKTMANGLGSDSVLGVYVSGGTVYAATVGGLSISTDGGNTFTNRTTANGLGTNMVNGVFASGNKVYAAVYGGGVSISDDGGNTFYSVLDGFPGRVFADSGRVYVSGGGFMIGVPTNVAPTVVTLNSSRNPSIAGITVTFTATVSAAGDTPTGTVAFKNNGVAIPGCVSPALSGGRATCMTSSLTVGSHTIYANYGGNTRFSASAGALSGGQVITQITPLIFVHGVAGSTLVKNGNEIWIGTPYLTSRRELSLIDSPPASVIATNAMSDALGIQPVYGPLLNYLKTTGGYVEYVPPVSPATGCNTSNPAASPTCLSSPTTGGSTMTPAPTNSEPISTACV